MSIQSNIVILSEFFLSCPHLGCYSCGTAALWTVLDITFHNLLLLEFCSRRERRNHQHLIASWDNMSSSSSSPASIAASTEHELRKSFISLIINLSVKNNERKEWESAVQSENRVSYHLFLYPNSCRQAQIRCAEMHAMRDS
jgi:hypothetical protein